jgi:hypothetical protein
MNTELKRKATELDTDDTLEFMAENMDFATALCKDSKFIDMLKNEASMGDIAGYITKEYKADVKRAVMWVNSDPITIKNARTRIDDVITALLEMIIGDSDFFTSPETEAEQTPSTSHSENTEANEQ